MLLGRWHKLRNPPTHCGVWEAMYNHIIQLASTKIQYYTSTIYIQQYCRGGGSLRGVRGQKLIEIMEGGGQITRHFLGDVSNETCLFEIMTVNSHTGRTYNTQEAFKITP